MYKGKVLAFFSQRVAFFSLGLGFSRWILRVPLFFWKRQAAAFNRELAQELHRLTPEHRAVYRMAIQYLLETGKPLEIIEVSRQLNLTIDLTEEIARRLEVNLELINRDGDGGISKAYPVSLDKSRHQLILSTGVETGAESLLNAMLIPPLAKLWSRQAITGNITVRCHQCRRPFHIVIGNDFKIKLLEENLSLLVYLPLETKSLGFAGILFCLRNACVYCSKDDAQKHRTANSGGRGYYLTLDECTTLMQSITQILAVFACP